MVVQDIETNKTIGILTWDWFVQHHLESYKKHISSKYLIKVSTFLPLQPMKPRVILRRARS